MAMFLLHIAFLLALAIAASGLVLWHRGGQPTAGVLRIGGGILVVGAVLSGLCIGYYGIRYHVQGDFDHAYAMHPPMDISGVMGPGGMMEREMMERGPMRRGGAPGEMRQAPALEPTDPSEHEEHHPEAAAPR